MCWIWHHVICTCLSMTLIACKCLLLISVNIGIGHVHPSGWLHPQSFDCFPYYNRSALASPRTSGSNFHFSPYKHISWRSYLINDIRYSVSSELSCFLLLYSHDRVKCCCCWSSWTVMLRAMLRRHLPPFIYRALMKLLPPPEVIPAAIFALLAALSRKRLQLRERQDSSALSFSLIMSDSFVSCRPGRLLHCGRGKRKAKRPLWLARSQKPTSDVQPKKGRCEWNERGGSEYSIYSFLGKQTVFFLLVVINYLCLM